MARGSGYGGVPAGPLSAYLSVRDRNEERGLRDLEGSIGAQGLLARMQQEQQQKQFQAEIASAVTPEQQLAVATKYGAPKDILAKISASRDRAEATKSREVIAEQNRIAQTQRTAETNRLRGDIAGMMEGGRNERAQERALNRPAPHRQFLNTDQGIYDVTGGDQQLMRDQGTGEPMRPPAPASSANLPFRNEATLRNEFAKLTSAPRKFYENFETISRPLAENRQPNIPEQRALITAYIKSMDPSDRISEGDWGRISNMMNIPQRIAASIQQLVSGKPMSQDVIKEMYGVIAARRDVVDEIISQAEADYEKLSREHRLEPSRVITTIGTSEQRRLRELRRKAAQP